MNKQLGRYELRRQVGRGAAGIVWEAWDTTLTRRVAVKVVRAGSQDALEIEELLTRFRQEAQVASCLSDASVVQVYDYGESDGEAYIVMEFVDGETLKALLDRGERLALARVAEIMGGVLLALELCHRQSIVHRDIKPANIMLPSGGGVKLADFGIARVENSDLTMVGTMLGTAAYMSPEQFTARSPVDFRSDIWSCGVLFYELLAGSRPFAGKTFSAISQAVANDPVEPPSRRVPGLPEALDQVVLRALRKKPSERFPSAQAFAQAIQAAMPVGPVTPIKPAGSQRKLAIGAAAAIVLLAAGGGWLWFDQRKPASVPVAAPAPAAPIQAVPAPSLPARVAALPCSTVTVLTAGPNGTSSFRGIIGTGEPRAGLDAILAGLPPSSVDTAGVQSFPSSDLSCRLAALVRANAGAPGTRLSTADGRTRLVDRDEIRLQLRMPDFDGEVHLEDLDADGKISNMMEGNFGAVPRHQAGTLAGLGQNGDSLIGRVTAPYGTDIMVTIVSSEPLFAKPRPREESGAAFIADLDGAMAALRKRGGRVAADAVVLTTAAR